MKFMSRSINKSFIWDITDERNRGLNFFGKKLKINTIGLKFSNQVTIKKTRKMKPMKCVYVYVHEWLIGYIAKYQ